MNKEQLLAKVDELIAQANELKELANKGYVILVPNNIKITGSVREISKGIVNGTQQLYYDTEDDHWVVEGHKLTDKIKCKLTPCKYEDLESGDIFYRDDNLIPKFNDLIGYAVKLKEGYQFWNKKDCNYGYLMFNYYWKLEEL